LYEDGMLLLAPVKQDTTASSDEITEIKPAMAAAVQNIAVLGQATADDDVVIKPTRTGTTEDTGLQRNLSSLSVASDHHAEASSMEPSSDSDAAKKSLGEVKPDCEPGFHDKELLNVLAAGSKAADVEMVSGDAAAGTASGNIGNERQPASEPDLAVVDVEVSIPAASASQQCSTPSVVMESNNADDAVTSTAGTSADKDERFRELMIKCTKALELCLTRFPQHYKSLYHLADVFFRCSSLKVSHLAYIPTQITMIF